ncbi:MAG TPA: TolC family protein [Puia sp.]|uniref:TolC family protein n=1 Tax=Puia sp. TaxID=2045100 RepID=UPI00092B4DB1|nr:TolC family protein [Puia sp.]MBN8852700.1 TolC family protein [Sphingobacteriales bacterium]OJW55524.1 MAG: transporter [Sphingobacteriales bacterium 50-39]HVU96826.1 TolC family protein [Puia sp.]
MNKLLITLIISILSLREGQAQPVMKLDDILSAVQSNHPSLKMYDADIRSMDEAAKGAKSWMPPELSTGFWMTPYNPSLWKKMADGTPGMGQYMISAQQMLPNKKEQEANARYMQAASAVSRESKQANLNGLYAAAKKSYYTWLITEKKIRVLDEDERLLNFMIQSTEIRYKNNLGKLNAYYKAKAALAGIENQRIMLQNEIRQQQIMLNTLMNRSKDMTFGIDTIYTIRDYQPADSSYLVQARSDLKAIDKNIQLTYLQQNLEQSKLKPQFGIRYDHMFGFGGLPMQYSLMAMVKLPIAAWSSKSYKANIESLTWKAESLKEQKQLVLNEATGQISGILAGLDNKKKQVSLYEEKIIPALQKNYQTMQLSYEQNTGELFELLDAWETLNMTQLEYLGQLQELLNMQVEMDKVLQQN